MEVGEEYAHLELLWDVGKGTLTAYVLDGECESSLRLEQTELQLQGNGWKGSLKAVASPLSGETVGDTSQFSGSLPALRGRTQWNGAIRSLTVQGRTLENLPLVYH